MTPPMQPLPAADAAGDTDFTARQAGIMAIVADQGFATIDALARHFEVSAQSIRRDIIRLDAAGLLQRFHGGAGAREATVRLGYAEKRGLATDAKDRIGRAAAALIPAGASVFLDVGTTVEAVARALKRRDDLAVFTVSLPAASLLADTGCRLHVLGGRVLGADGALGGESTLAAIARFRFDVAVIGYSGFDDDGALMDFDLEKVAVKRAAIARARVAAAVGHAAKFTRSALVRVEEARAIGHLVSDAMAPRPLRERLSQAGVRITVA